MKNLVLFLVALLALASIHVTLAVPVETDLPNPITALPLPIFPHVAVPFDALRGALVRFATTDATREALLAAISQPNSLVDEVCMGVSESDRESLMDQLSSIGQPAARATRDENEVTIPVIVTLRSATAYLQEQIQNIASAAREDAKVTLEPSQFASGLKDIAEAWESDAESLSQFFRELITKNDIIQKFLLDLAYLIPGFKLPKDDDEDDDDETDPEARYGEESPVEEVIVVKGTEDDNADDQEADPKGTTVMEIDPMETTAVETDAKDTTAVKIDAKDTTPVETEPKETTAVETEPKDTTALETAPKDTTAVETDAKDTTAFETEPTEPTAVETDAETTQVVTARRLQEVGKFIIPTEFLPEDFKNVVTAMGDRMFGVFSQFGSQLSDSMISSSQSVLPFPNLLGDDRVNPVVSEGNNDELEGPMPLNNPMSLVTAPLEFLGAPLEMLGGSPPLETLMSLFNPADLSIFDPTQLAALLPMGEMMTSMDLLSAFSFENLQSVFSPETLSVLPMLIDAQNADALQGLLSPEALANAMEDSSPFALLIERAREGAKLMGDSTGFLAREGQPMLPLLNGAVEAPIALFNLLGSDAFNDAIDQLSVETSS